MGNLENTEVFNFYKDNQIDVFINTSSSEGIPVSIMEAQSFGVPVIATDVGGTKEIVNSKNGFFLSSNPSNDEIASAIIDAANNNDKWTQKRIHSYNSWKEKYNAEENYSIFAKKLVGLIG